LILLLKSVEKNPNYFQNGQKVPCSLREGFSVILNDDQQNATIFGLFIYS